MKDDKITAMWEDDGDLMRLKTFFAYIHQDDTLKERVKHKTLDKISDLDKTAQIPEQPGINKEIVEVNRMEDETKPDQKSVPFFKKRPNWKGFKAKNLKMLSAAAVVAFAVYLGSTGMLLEGNSPLKMGSAKSAENVAEPGMPAPAPTPPSFTSGFMDEAKQKTEGMGAQDSAQEFSARSSIANGTAPTEPAPEETVRQKIIYIMEASLKADDVAVTVSQIEEKVNSMGGYIAESRQNNYENQINAYLTLRVPVAEFQRFKGELSSYGTVSNQNLYTDDVSRQYFDTETRLRSWEAQEKRYLEILQQAKTVEEILRIEEYLANVRREMESLKGQLKYWDNRVEFSEVRLNITSSQNVISVNDPWQPIPLKNTLTAAKNAVIKSISFIWNAINYLLIILGYAFPLILVGGAGWMLYQWKKKSRTS